MSLDAAIQATELEIEQLQARKTTVGSTIWWQLQSKSLALSYLRTMKAKGITDPTVAEAYRKAIRAQFNLADDA